MSAPDLLLPGQSPARWSCWTPAWRRQWLRLRLRCLLLPVLLKLVWWHWTCPQGRQFARLGRTRRHPRVPLPESWAHWVAHRVGRFLFRLPGLRRRPCYWRSLMLLELLPRFGFPVRLHLGVPRAGGHSEETTPHLWVSTRGILLADTPQAVAPYLELGSYSSEDAS